MGNTEFIYDMITDKIVKQLESGTAPWHKSWTVDSAPRSINGHVYEGINVFLTLAAGFSSPYWITFDEIKRRKGGFVKGQEKQYTTLIWWKILKFEDETQPDGFKKVPSIRYYRAWNLEQTTGIKPPKSRTAPKVTVEARHNQAAAIVANMPHPPVIRENGGKALYRPGNDTVTVPPRESFDSLDEFYSTEFHELTHSTAHETRLDRKSDYVFGSHSYGREELVAEMGAAFLCAIAGIENTINNSAAYLASWIKTIKEDTHAVVFAAAQAQRAVKLILGQQATGGSDTAMAAELAVAA